MPNEVGKDLQSAQDAIQKTTGDSAYITFSKDATGQNRHQIFDADWRVCSETPKTGESFTATKTVTFYVVKQSEKCP